MHPLLPYLEAFSGTLKISFTVPDSATRETGSSPFTILSEPDPFSALIHARFLTDAGSTVKQAFLLIQKDAYPCTIGGPRPITNRDIEHAWQAVYDYYLRADAVRPPLLLSGQLTQGGRAVRLPPMFYCTQKATFFLPPCPKCGRALGQCEDDALLEQAGLQPYASSLKRYLHCASCGGPEPGAFYVKERERTDPPGLGDREELIHAFGRCRETADPETRFPCPGCPHHSECYPPGNLAGKRIAVLSFYPFYLLTFEAMSVCAADFVALLSGATVNDQAASLQGRGEQGRLGLLRALGGRGSPGAAFLFEGDERWFLEILYLKLSFLGDVLRTLVGESDILRHPEMAPALERLWVEVPDQCGLLPLLWNFRVQLIDIGSRTPSPVLFPERSGPLGLHLLGLLWLETLLANRRQDNARVHDALRRAAEGCPLEDELFVDRNFRGRRHPAFQPENLFWEPEGQRVNEAWTPLWEKALRLGWTLLAASSKRGPEWSAEAFQREVESLRRDVRDALFPRPSPGVQQAAAARENEQGESLGPSRPRTEEDEAIRSILDRIRGRWKVAGDTRTKALAEEEELQKTRILSVAGTRQPPGAGRSEGGGEEEEAVVVETIVVSPAGTPERLATPPGSTSPAAEAPEATTQPPADTDGEELGETIILDAAKLRGKGKDGSKR